MNTLGATQTIFFPPTGHSPLNPRRLRSGTRPGSTCFCRSGGNGSESSDPSPSPTDGDKKKQDLLARIAMLQTQKVRLTDFLDEKSAYLTQFAEDANAEFEQIGESALKELDEASARIMENLDSRYQEFEEAAEVNRQEIERNEKELEQFEDQIEKDRNEGLFFKSLTSKKPPKDEEAQAARAAASAEAKKLLELNKAKAGSKTRQNIYLALMSLVGVGVANVLVSSTSSFSEVDWKKAVALGFIFLALLAQYVYELNLSSQGEKDDKRK